MSDINQIDGPTVVPAKTAKTPDHGLRWRIIPGTFLAIFSVIGSIGMAIETFDIVYYNLKYGWIRVDPASPGLSRLAVTPVNCLVWVCASNGFVIAGFSAYAWFYGKWRFAWIGTILFFSLMIISKWLELLLF